MKNWLHAIGFGMWFIIAMIATMGIITVIVVIYRLLTAPIS